MYDILIRTAFGLESVASGELRHLGYSGFRTRDGAVTLSGSAYDLARLHYWLRSADRVQLQFAAFRADNLDALFDGIRAVRWEDVLPEDARIVALAKTGKGWMQSGRTCQSLTKKAVLNAMGRRYKRERFPETGRDYVITTEILDTEVTVTLDATGDALHKRGYRKETGEAPIRENVAAAMVLLARWFGKSPLLDPFCGSGTIPIEAAMIALGMAPGRNRRFAWEGWGFLDRTETDRAGEEAKEPGPWKDPGITGRDIDPKAVSMAQAHAERAGVARVVRFEQGDAFTLDPGPGPGLILCNPPWGERLGEEEAARETARGFGAAWKKLKGWDCGVITALQGFEKEFGTRAVKNRKLYNGKLLSRFYTFSTNTKR